MKARQQSAPLDRVIFVCIGWILAALKEHGGGKGGGRRKVQLAKFPVGEATEICLQSIGNLMRLLFNLNSCTEERFPLQANAEAVEQSQD